MLVALPGAVLPDGAKLGGRAARRRSEGMILSETEVQIGTTADGIMVLPDSFESARRRRRYLPLGDDVLELEVNPNRPDCLASTGSRASCTPHRRAAGSGSMATGRRRRRGREGED